MGRAQTHSASVPSCKHSRALCPHSAVTRVSTRSCVKMGRPCAMPRGVLCEIEIACSRVSIQDPLCNIPPAGRPRGVRAPLACGHLCDVACGACLGH
eukprot:4573865-Alexandrium_andersonii.AAC.1